MDGNIDNERYDSARDCLEIVQTVRRLMDNDSEAYEAQTKVAEFLKTVTYDGTENFDSLKSRRGEDIRSYREEHGWTFDAYESYEEVSASTLDEVMEGLSKELLPRDGKDNNIGDRGMWTKFRVPTVDGVMLPLIVTNDDQAEEGIKHIRKWLEQEGIMSSRKEQSEKPKVTANSGETEPAEEGSLRDNLEQLPRIGDGSSEEVADILRQSPELFEEIANNLDYVESIETDFDPLSRLSEEQQEMANDLLEADWSEEEVIQHFA